MSSSDRERAQRAGEALRVWAVQRYPDVRLRELMRKNLSIPAYRPAYDPNKNYQDVMEPVAALVADTARRRSNSLSSSRGARPVVYAMSEAMSPKATRPLTRMA